MSSGLHQRKVIQVGISDVKYSNDGSVLKTTLGSCVAVILFAEQKKSNSLVCSMSHFLLPKATAHLDLKNKPNRFADIILPQQIAHTVKQGISIENMRAKVAGGASILSHRVKSVLPDIGRLNKEIAHSILKEHGIRVISSNTGGEIGRSIEFDPHSQKLKVHIFGSEPIFI